MKVSMKPLLVYAVHDAEGNLVGEFTRKESWNGLARFVATNGNAFICDDPDLAPQRGAPQDEPNEVQVEVHASSPDLLIALGGDHANKTTS